MTVFSRFRNAGSNSTKLIELFAILTTTGLPMTLDIYNDDGDLVFRQVFCRAELESMLDDKLDATTGCTELDHILDMLLQTASDELENNGR